MQQHYIIDGYNIIHAIPSLKKALLHDAILAREQLALAVANFIREKKMRFTIVFDGAKPHDLRVEPLHSPIHIVYAFPLSADEKIKSMIEQSKNRSLLVIISSDHEIINFARVCSCTTHTSQYFAQLLRNKETLADEKDQSSLSKSQVDEWLRIFNSRKSDE